MKLIGSKVCIECGEEKGFAHFQYYATTKTTRAHIGPRCKPCISAYRKAKRYERNRLLPQNNERPMPDLPDPEVPGKCQACKDDIYDGTDGNGFATLTCQCGTRFAPRIHQPKQPRLGQQGSRKRTALPRVA